MNSAIKPMSRDEWLLLLLLSVVWGGSFFFVGIAVEALPPLTIVALRVSLAALALLAVVFFTDLKMVREVKIWLAFIFLGILNNVVPFTLIVWGQTHIASGLASILNATTPIFTLVAAHLLTRDEKITSHKLVGVLIGFGGVILMLGDELMGGFSNSLIAQLAVLGAAISYALAGIFGRRFAKIGIKPMVTATGQVTASSVFLIPLAIFHDQPFSLPMPGIEILLAILGLALISTAFAYILYFRILATAGATNLLMVTLLIPVSAILLGTLLLGEQLELKHLAGMSLISIGLLLIDGRVVKRIVSRVPISEANRQS